MKKTKKSNTYKELSTTISLQKTEFICDDINEPEFANWYDTFCLEKHKEGECVRCVHYARAAWAESASHKEKEIIEKVLNLIRSHVRKGKLKL